MVGLFGLIMIGIIILIITTKDYKRELFQSCNKKENRLLFLYPTMLFIYERLKLEKVFDSQSKAKKAIQLLSVKGESCLQYQIYALKKMSIIFLILCVGFIGMVYMELTYVQSQKQIQKGILQRPEGAETEEQILSLLVLDNGKWVNEEIVIEIQPHKEKNEATQNENGIQAELESTKETKRLYSYAYEYIDDVILNGNIDLQHISSNIILPKAIPNTELSIEWMITPTGIIGFDGQVTNSTLQEETQVHIQGKIQTQDSFEIGTYEVNVVVIPEVLRKHELWKEALKNSIEDKAESMVSQEVIQLPMEYEGKEIRWRSNADNMAGYVMLFGAVIGVLMFFVIDEQLDHKIKNRQKQIHMDYSDILNKLTLLINAGMTISGAWERIVIDYEKLVEQKEGKNQSKMLRYAYEEMRVANNEMHLGVSEMKAIEDFGKRAGSVRYLKLSSMLIQNMRKGSEGLTHILELMATESFEDRKQKAKQLGEEAGTKLLLPMMVMLILVLVIIMVPAFWSMRI